MEADGLSAVPELLAAMGGPDEHAARRAAAALTGLGAPAVPLLRRIRRDGPGGLRSAALSALAAIGGEAALSPGDTAAVERLVRVKLPDDRPAPLAGCWNHWIAVPGGDQAGIMELLGLVRPRPVTFALATDVVNADGHEGWESGTSPFSRVFVTPELDGWTFVVGPWCDPADIERGEEVLRACEALSARYGRAQAYCYGAQNDGSAWLVAEGGTVLRRYCESGEAEDELLTLGEPLPYEHARRAELGLPPWDTAGADEDDEEEEWTMAAFALAPDLAAHLGVNPLAIGPDTPVRGTGVLALTPYATTAFLPPGCHRV